MSGWSVFSECINPDRADYGASPTFAGWFASREEADREAAALQTDDRVAWVSADKPADGSRDGGDWMLGDA
jgi:hypothetical protein